MLGNERFIYGPKVSLIASNVMTLGMFENAVAEMDLTHVLEKEGTPLNRIADASKTGDGMGDLLAEYAGRFCYRSFAKGRSTADYIENIIQMKHGSVFEHATVSLQIIGVSRSLTHELIRHRAGTGYSQESQRYVDAGSINFVVPPLLAFLEANRGDLCASSEIWRRDVSLAHASYVNFQETLKLAVNQGEISVVSMQDGKNETAMHKRIMEAARSLLPNAAETRLVMSLNMRALLHITLLRGSEGADLEIRRLACHIVEAARPYAPLILADIEQIAGSFGVRELRSEYGAI